MKNKLRVPRLLQIDVNRMVSLKLQNIDNKMDNQPNNPNQCHIAYN